MQAHPIGLWDDAATLPAQETIGPGAGDLLIENFQYVAIGGITADAGGDLRESFTRVRCPRRRYESLVAFSCRRA